MNQSFARIYLKETNGSVLVIAVINSHVRYERTKTIIGCLQIFGSKKGRFICNSIKNNIRPKSKGSVGRNRPKFSVYSSMFMDKGVKKAMAKKKRSVSYRAK